MMMIDFRGERLNFDIADDEDFMQHLTRYVFAKKYCSGRVLDMACGVGYGSYFLCSATNVESVIGADISEPAISFGSKTFTNSKLRYQIESAIQTDFPDGSFDTIVSLETIEHIRELALFMKEIKRLLRAQGIFIVSLPNKKFFHNAGIKNDFHYHEMLYEDLLPFLSEYFSDLELFYQFFPIKRYEQILPKLQFSSYCGFRMILKKLLPLQLKSTLLKMKRNFQYGHLALKSVKRSYGMNFDKFLNEKTSLREQYKIIPMQPELYNMLPGNFIAVCKNKK